MEFEHHIHLKKNIQATTTQLLGHGRAVPMEPFGVVLGSLNTNKMIDRFRQYAANMDELIWNYDMIWLLIMFLFIDPICLYS